MYQLYHFFYYVGGINHNVVLNIHPVFLQYYIENYVLYVYYKQWVGTICVT